MTQVAPSNPHKNSDLEFHTHWDHGYDQASLFKEIRDECEGRQGNLAEAPRSEARDIGGEPEAERHRHRDVI